MTPSPAHGVPYTIPPEPNRLPSIVIALLVHAGLLGFLWVGIRWQNVEPTSVEAEVWDMKTESAAPPPKPQAPPEPVRQPDPVPVPKVVPPPPKVEEPVAPKAPDIALERQKEKKKLLEKKLAEEKLEKEKAKQLAQLEEKKLEDLKAREKANQLAKEKADKLAREKADKLAKAALDKAESKKLDDLRAAEMKRVTSQAGGSGSAEKSTAPRIDTGYVAAVTSKIKRSTSYNGDTDVAGNPRTTFKIEQLPTGEIISVRKTKSSGIAAFDDAVERGINNSSPLPKKKDGTVERSIEVSILMKELD